VSVLWGLGEPDTATAVRAAHDAAVDAALGWLEREGCRSRRGIDGHETIAADGFVAAAFVHRSSRAGDPQLHTHVLVANLAHCEDGKWRALDGKALLWQAHTAGYLYKAHLRHELTRRLGVGWAPVLKGAAEIDGIAPDLCRLFSTRRREIEDELAARGASSPQAARAAGLETRRAKDPAVGADELRVQWAARAREAGRDPALVQDALGRCVPTTVDDRTVANGTSALLGPEGLTDHASVFDRRDVLRAWCAQLRRGAAVATIEELAGVTLADQRVVALTDRSSYPRFSTAELVALEHRLVTRATTATDRDRGVVPETALRTALDARPELSPEQVAVVAELTTSGKGVDVLVAAAGTGKTFCLDAARDAWTASGHHVIGAALAATAAAQLQAQAAIPSDTLALRALQLADGSLHLDRDTVLVIDEAAMVGTRQLRAILDAAHDARAKVVLVGDPKQLNAIHAGGLLNGLAQRLPTVTLAANRRQHEAWERSALTRLRDGDIDEALALYDAHDRIVTAPTAIDLRNRIAGDWHAATVAGDQVVMLAERRHDVDDLNHRARHLRAAAGALTGPTLDLDGRSFQTGDRVLCLRNDRRLGVHNGTLATVTVVDPAARAVTIRTDAGTHHALPARYLDAGHLTHGYALTIHKSQGLTVDRCLILATDTLDHNAGYTALSRGRAENRFYVHGALPDPEAHHAVDRQPIEAREILEGALRRTRDDRLAIDHEVDISALRAELHDLHRERAHLLPVRTAMPPDLALDLDSLVLERERLVTRRSDAQAQLQRGRPGLRDRRDRLVRHLAAGRAVEQATSQLESVDAELARATSAQQVHERYRHEHQPELDRLDVLEERIDHRLDLLAASFAVNPPAYLEQQLGALPDTEYGQSCWLAAAHVVERYRTGHDIDDPTTPFGAEPRAPEAADDWREATALLRYYCAGLRSAQAPEPSAEAELPGIER
jgi:Ti-type conjugative transfer relaxase TraA